MAQTRGDRMKQGETSLPTEKIHLIKSERVMKEQRKDGRRQTSSSSLTKETDRQVDIIAIGQPGSRTGQLKQTHDLSMLI